MGGSDHTASYKAGLMPGEKDGVARDARDRGYQDIRQFYAA